jgi:hypothetical protein
MVLNLMVSVTHLLLIQPVKMRRVQGSVHTPQDAALAGPAALLHAFRQADYQDGSAGLGWSQAARNSCLQQAAALL